MTTDTYVMWVNQLKDMIQEDTFCSITNNLSLSVYKPKSEDENISIHVINNNNSTKMLVIDSTSIKPYYDKIGDPNFTYQQSLAFAKNNCLKFIKQWAMA